MRLLAFQGLRYTTRAGDSGDLAAPPYDQIDDAARDRYHAASPHQFVHLTRPVAGPGTQPGETDPYHHAAALHRQWLRDGIVARDPRPALYPYVVALAGGGRRLGVMALVGYAPPDVIRPHEQTLDKPLAERSALLEAMRVDLEPALLLADDDGRLDALIAADLADLEGAAGVPPLASYRDDAGHHHLLHRIDAPARLAEYQQVLAERPAAIADGHHRYKVGQQFAAAHGAAPGSAAGAKLAVVTSLRARNLTIDPIHRALRQPLDAGRLTGLRTAAVPFSGASGTELARAVAAAPQPALGVWVSGHGPEIWRLAAPDAAPSAAGGGSGLVVEIFQHAVLPALGLAPAAATDGTIVYRANPDELFAQVARGELGTGFWLPPMLPAEFAAAIAHGALLPPKSTRFLPKAMSGLVWSDHDSQVS
jgi:uncharacterized protein (DUF1015 family)